MKTRDTSVTFYIAPTQVDNEADIAAALQRAADASIKLDQILGNATEKAELEQAIGTTITSYSSKYEVIYINVDVPSTTSSTTGTTTSRSGSTTSDQHNSEASVAIVSTFVVIASTVFSLLI